MISKRREYLIRTRAYGLWRASCRDIENIMEREGIAGLWRILANGQDETCQNEEERRYFETCFYYGTKKHKDELDRFCKSYWKSVSNH